MNVATPSEFELFNETANQNRVDYSLPKQKKTSPAPFVVAPPPPSPPPQQRPPSPPPKSRHSSSKQSRRSAPASVASTRYSQTTKGKAEKQEYLLQLRKLKLQGCQLTREYTNNDRLNDIKYEVERQRNYVDTKNSVELMADGLKLGISGIEMANARLGPFLNLTGWSDACTNDMSRYHHVLERIYRRYWTSGTNLHPVVELGLVLSSSMMMYHFQSKMFGPPPTATPSYVTPPKSIPIDRNAKRRRMRPPTTSTPAAPMPPAPASMFSNLEQIPQQQPNKSNVPLQPIVRHPVNSDSPVDVRDLKEDLNGEGEVRDVPEKNPKKKKSQKNKKKRKPEEEEEGGEVDEEDKKTPAYMDTAAPAKKKKKKSSPTTNTIDISL